MLPKSSYIVGCTPRSGSHLLCDLLISSGVAGHPDERFPRYDKSYFLTAAERDALVTESMPESSFDEDHDAAYVREIIESGTSSNGVFGICIHWLQLNDAVRRIRSYSKLFGAPAHEVLRSAFPGLSYIWLIRRDKVAQAVSWYKAIQTGRYVTLVNDPRDYQVRTAEFNYIKIKEYWTALRSAENGWRFFFRSNNLRPLILYYEDMAQDPHASARAALEHLGVHGQDISLRSPRHKKVADAQSEEWVRLFNLMQFGSKR